MGKRWVTREELKSQYPPAAYEDMSSDERLSRVQLDGVLGDCVSVGGDTPEENVKSFVPGDYPKSVHGATIRVKMPQRFIVSEKFEEQKRKDNQRYLLACAFLFGAVCGAVGILTAAYFFYGGN
jgi:hypothetical protein